MRVASSNLRGWIVAGVLLLAAAASVGTATAKQATPGRSQSAGREAEVLKASEAWFDALMRGDVDALARSQTDDFLTIQQAPGGVAVVAGPEQLGNLKKAGTRPSFKRTLTAPRVRFYGTVAILTGVATFDGQAGGKAVQSKSVTTEVWVNRDGRWLLAHFQPTDPGRPAAQP